MVKDVVGGCGEAAGVGENEVGGHEQVGDVLRGDVVRDRLMTAGWAGVLENGLLSAGSIQTSLKTAVRRLWLVVPR